ncbi:hypothetical protein K488DRAFT_24823, partial [Vararia minispora EC-137]
LNRIPHNWIIWGVIGANAVVFTLWGMSETEMKNRRPQFQQWMLNNFTVSWQNLSAGRFWTVITSAFSQMDFMHALFNGLTFYWMAPATLSALGGARFTYLYLSGALRALACSGATLYFNPHIASLGASGAVYSIIATFACMFPRTTFYLFGIAPLPAWAFVGGILAWDGYNAWQVSQRTATPPGGSKTNYIGHVGGVLTGIAYYLLR